MARKSTWIPFVEGWSFAETLGEGAYGEVKLAINNETQHAVAVKIIDGSKPHVAAAKDNIRKEVCILKLLSPTETDSDLPIVRCYGSRTEGHLQFIFLEFLSGGELFDRIEPEVGMAPAQARRFFRQLICGVQYLHDRGIAHRDIKPENLLLDAMDNLKISDFGLATVFRHKGHTRKLQRSCGTPPYVAPEVMKGWDYSAEPADLWSCGIVLVAMLAGELPWDEPLEKNKEFSQWRNKNIACSPWPRLSLDQLSLVRKLLFILPKERANMRAVQGDAWYCRGDVGESQPSNRRHCLSDSLSPPAKRKHSDLYLTTTRPLEEVRFSLSQPLPISAPDKDTTSSSEADGALDIRFFCSQPANMDDLLCSQMVATQETKQGDMMQQLVRRMTRFWMECSVELAAERMENALYKQHGESVTRRGAELTVTVLDRRGSQLAYKVRLMEMKLGFVLVDFRLSKGDGIEFKKFFVHVRKRVRSHIVNAPA